MHVHTHLGTLQVDVLELPSAAQVPFALCTVGALCPSGEYKFFTRVRKTDLELMPLHEILNTNDAGMYWALGPATNLHHQFIKHVGDNESTLFAVDIVPGAPHAPTVEFSAEGFAIAFRATGGARCILRNVLQHDGLDQVGAQGLVVDSRIV